MWVPEEAREGVRVIGGCVLLDVGVRASRLFFSYRVLRENQEIKR